MLARPGDRTMDVKRPPKPFMAAPRPNWKAALALTGTLQFVDVVALTHLSRGLTFDPLQCADVLDHALVSLDQKTGYTSEVASWVRAGALAAGSCPLFPSGRIIAEVSEATNRSGQTLRTAAILEFEPEADRAPAVFLAMVSPTLGVPMRLEIPLRAVLKGNPPLEGSYTLYLHVLLASDGSEYCYYGITKRGWNLRFTEHTRDAVAKQSKRLFAQKLKELTVARAAELYGTPDARPKLSGLVSVVCGSGLSQAAAFEAEEAMVEKYSLASKHPLGLNMIPGGLAGARTAKRFRRGR